ncbi:MAG: tetratricopeptide repeat protein [Candidatus Omnitrophota bacterium]
MQVRKSILIALIIAACLASYFNTLFFDFVWDDNIFIVPNPYMKSFKFLPKFLSKDFWNIGVFKWSSGYYRPFLAASFMWDHKLWGINPFGYHLTNLIFHILCCILIFLIVELLINNRKIALFSSLIFSVHPVHTEAVSFISGRVDVIPPALFLLSIFYFFRFANNKRIFFYLFSLLSFSAALLTKEMAVTLPVIIICLDYFFLSKQDAKGVFKNFLRLHLGFFVILALYFIARFNFIGKLFIATQYGINFPNGTQPFWRLFTVIKILAIYLRLLFFPYGLKVQYNFPAANSFFEPEVLIGSSIILLLIYLVIKNRKRNPILSFSILWFFITILPVSNIIPQGNIFAERYVYLPSVGYCIAIALLFNWLLTKNIKTDLFNWKKSLYVLFFLLILALGRVTYERNKVWENEFTLWYDAVQKEPQSPKTHANLARVYYDANLLDEAMKEIRIALQIRQTYSYDLLNGLGCIYMKKKDWDQAILAFELAIETSPERELAYNGLGIAYVRKGKACKEAIELFHKALEKNPYFDWARYNLAACYHDCGYLDEAINNFQEYLKTNPDFYGVYVELGHAYYKKGNYNKAKEQWLKALEIKKDYQPAKDALKLLEN